MAERKKMSVAEILAAARAEKAAGAANSPPADATAAESAVVNEKAAEKPAVAKPAAAKPAAARPAAAGERPSVKDILAMARQNKGEAAASGAESSAAAKPAEAKPAAEKPAAKPAAKKPAAAPGQVAKPFTSLDTASILAAARTAAKPGPVSKSDAPLKPRPAPEKKPAAASVAPVAARPMPKMPAKPQIAKKAEDGEDRRGFLEIALGSFMAVGFTALSVTGGLFTLGLARFLFPNVLAEPPSRFKVGFKEGFPSGKVETKFVAQFGVWVVNSDVQGQQQIFALKTVCTHLGCTPNWLEAEQKFKCPCHGSGFYKDGVNFEGPAPSPLERYAIRVSDDGQLEVDKSRTFKEQDGQWADPSSFVPV